MSKAQKKQNQKGVETKHHNPTGDGFGFETAVCPFCAASVRSDYNHKELEWWNVTGGCVHFIGFYSAGGTSVEARFNGDLEQVSGAE